MVVVNGSWCKNAVSYPGTGDVIVTSKMAARAVLICRPNSHPFQERTLSLDQPVKIGRSVARARAVPNNAIFDCKVLSRNHALLWYENGKFYLQDTKSSNGTFVNNQRLSKGAEESPPREVCSGDIVQFGVDVMENARKVTHGCIVATLKLYLPDGKEAKASPSTSVVSSVGMVPLEDLYQLNQYLQEAIGREQVLENKLATLQHLVETTRQASDLGWKALIDEDRLLSRVEILENQLQVYSKNFAEDKLREELRKLQEDKSQYQGSAKESLRKILQEKIEAIQKLQDLEQTLSNTENECANLKKLCEQSQQDLQDLAQKYSLQLQKVEDLSAKLEDTEEQNRETCEKLEQEKQELEVRLQEQLDAEQALQLRLEALQIDGDLTQQKLAALQSHLHLLRSNEDNDNMKETDSSVTQAGGDVDVILERIDLSTQDNMKEEVESLRYQLKKYEEELQDSHARVNQLHHQVEVIELEEKDRLDQVTKIKVQLEDVRNQEDTSQETTLQLQERLEDIDLEIDLVQSDSDTNKNNVPPSPHHLTKLKAEKVKLEELLNEARAKKRAAELQRGQYQCELDCANVKVKKTTEEANVLKQQLAAAQCQMNAKNETVQELQKQMVWLENSTDELKQQLVNLQERLHDEQVLGSKFAVETEQLRKQLMEAQQNAKQSHNEAEQMKDRLKALTEELEAAWRTGANLDADNRSREELAVLRTHCSNIELENDRLKLECSQLEGVKQELMTIQRELTATQLQQEVQPITPTVDALLLTKEELEKQQQKEIEREGELVMIKQEFVQCNEEKTQLARELQKLQEEFGALANQSYAVLWCSMIPLVVVFLGIVSAFYPTLSFITGTLDAPPKL